MHRTLAALLGLAAAAPFTARAASSAEVLDLAGRVHYGYYHAEPRTIETAQSALDRLDDSPEVLYYRDFAALRRAQLGGSDRASQARLRDCAQRDPAANVAKSFAADAWALSAACALIGGDVRRSERALALARKRKRSLAATLLSRDLCAGGSERPRFRGGTLVLSRLRLA